jgi:hypothetical protein
MLWARCRDGTGSIRWPDGGGFIDQPQRLIRAFDIIAAEWPKYDERAG